MAALLWFLLALLLLAIAWLGPDLDGLLAAAIAALGLSLLTAAAPALALTIQLPLFIALTAALLLGLQRWSRRRRQRSIPASGSSERAQVISGFEPGEDAGRVRWQGQSWAAVNLEAIQGLAPGAEVLVMGREGNRLQVLSASASRERSEL
jgi:inner membrane protein